jgi:8-oxo-dGTP diphosphatase
MNEQCYYRISVKGLAIDETGRFLLSKEDNGKWELPGGGLDHGEDPHACLTREIHEETGLVITYVSPAPKYLVTSKRANHDTYIANIIYEIKLRDLEFTPSEECVELKYFNVQEAKKLSLFPNVEAFLRAYNPSLHV